LKLNKSIIHSSFISKLKLLNEKISLLENNFENLFELITLSKTTLNKKGKIIFAGNGGSASQSQHMAAELVNRYKLNRRSLPSVSLTSDTAVITSIANDFKYKYIFSRQLSAIGNKNDLLILLSSSNKSLNILEAIQQAKKMKIKSVLITSDKAKIVKKTDLIIKLPCEKTDTYQELELIFSHFYIEMLEGLI
tara:strand:+ start:3376 stop:3954 length:579 start_codon:yes stop_codon:yes gene_type:complete